MSSVRSEVVKKTKRLHGLSTDEKSTDWKVFTMDGTFYSIVYLPWTESGTVDSLRTLHK